MRLRLEGRRRLLKIVTVLCPPWHMLIVRLRLLILKVVVANPIVAFVVFVIVWDAKLRKLYDGLSCSAVVHEVTAIATSDADDIVVVRSFASGRKLLPPS